MCSNGTMNNTTMVIASFRWFANLSVPLIGEKSQVKLELINKCTAGIFNTNCSLCSKWRVSFGRCFVSDLNNFIGTIITLLSQIKSRFRVSQKYADTSSQCQGFASSSAPQTFDSFRNFLKLLCLANDQWRGFSTRNAHMVHIVYKILSKIVYTS